MSSRINPSLTRDQLTALYECSHSELGRLLRERQSPLPIRVEGAVLWFEDEVKSAVDKIKQRLARTRARR